jgi:methionine-rich copper-binding protein CopC
VKSSPLAAAVLAISLGWIGQASAHAHLVTATPSDGAVTGAPARIELTFSEPIELAFSGVDVVGPEKAKVQAGAPGLSADRKGLVVALPDDLPAGTYSVEWHVLAADGHKTDGTYAFTVKPR